MSVYSSIATLACLAVLAACASAPPPAPAPPPKPTMVELLAQADSALAAKQEVRALAIFKQATWAFPREKAAWMRVAQLSFDSHAYGEAITYAQAVLERDPEDIKAHSIVAVSGLRVSSQALRDLAQKNDVTGPVRLEAQQLAKLLRSSIGGDIIVPVKRPVPRPAVVKPAVIDQNDPLRVLREEMGRSATTSKGAK